MKTDYLIIGFGAAGLNASVGIRSVDRKGKITIVSSEQTPGYSRPMISYYLGNRVSKQAMFQWAEGFLDENNVEVLSNMEVKSIDTKERKAFFRNLDTITFRKVLIATGGYPIVPAIEGFEKAKKGVFTFTTIKDADRIIKYAGKEKLKNAVVLGAGLIGLKCTEGLFSRGLKVSIVELADRVLAGTFDKKASFLLEKGLSKWGCSIYKSNTVSKILSVKGGVKKVLLKNGESIVTKLLIIATGVKPDIAVASASGIKTDKGILVNEHMQTNIKSVYAAGDVAQVQEFITGSRTVLAIWLVAAETGRIAGRNMASSKNRVKYDGGFVMNSVEIAGIPTISFGLSREEGGEFEILEKINPVKNEYRKIVLLNNKIVGAIFMGKIERAGIFSGLIRDGLDVSTFKNKLLDDNFGFLLLPKEYRKEKFASPAVSVFD